MTTKKAAQGRSGKAVNMWLREGDLATIRTLATFISSKGYRVSDSQIIAACLRVAKPNSGFLKAFEDGLLLDGRRKIEE